MPTGEFLTPEERAAAVALEAHRRGLWTTETALAFVAYAGKNVDGVRVWEKTLADLVDSEEEARALVRKQEELQDEVEGAYEEVRDYQNSIRDFGSQVATGAITTGRTKLFGKGY